jgi:hypothetical protein
VREFHYLLQGLTPEKRQVFRQRILAVDADQIARVAQRYLVDGWQQSAVSVVAGEDMLKDANRQLGDDALALGRI